MRRLLPLTALLLTLAACGKEAPTDEQQVRKTLSTFASAVEGRDYQVICEEVFARELLEGLQQIGLPCEVAMRTSLGKVDEPKLTVGEVTVDGTTARAQVRTSAAGQEPSSDTLELKKTGEERWQVSALSAPPETKGSPEPAESSEPAESPEATPSAP